jgi:molybdopterin molybdotransferase
MISVDEALRIVMQAAAPLPSETVPLEAALGRVLAEDVAADVDSPFADKALVDGYAVIAADLQQRLAGDQPALLRILEEVVAGAVPTLPIEPGAATRIMTGAPMPAGANAVAMIEQTESLEIDGQPHVRISPPAVASGRNFLPQGVSFRRGEVVLAAGARLRSMEIGLLAEVGRGKASVIKTPRVAILSTGNELVDVSERPGPGRLRNSNGPMLAAQVLEAGGDPIPLGIARDDADELRRLVERGLRSDVLVLSGGVSAGILDLVPATLASLGVQQLFHKIRLKPGKPLWFGTLGQKLVFGLPGNPVSSLVCFHLFVKPALARLAGRDDAIPQTLTAQLSEAFFYRGDRPTYCPADVTRYEQPPRVRLTAWKGSADLRSLAAANCLACFSEGDRHYSSGDPIDVVEF